MKEMQDLKAEYDKVEIPIRAKESVLAGIARAKEEMANEKSDKNKIIRFPVYARIATGVAAAFAVCFISVNTSGQIASAAAKLPVIGKFFEVITVREYVTDDVNAEIPGILEGSSLATGEVNRQTEGYINEIIAEFEAENNAGSLDINYEVLTDNDKYFSVDIKATDTEASGYEFHRFYTIDKANDEVLTLEKLFDGKEYIRPISEEIIRQMKADTDTEYFIGGEDDGFEKIAANQNFFISDKGSLVICFDEYEVGPGSIGAVQFEIPKEVIERI